MTLQDGWLQRQFESNNKTIQGWSAVKQQVIFRNTTPQQAKAPSTTCTNCRAEIKTSQSK